MEEEGCGTSTDTFAFIPQPTQGDSKIVDIDSPRVQGVTPRIGCQLVSVRIWLTEMPSAKKKHRLGASERDSGMTFRDGDSPG